MDWLSSSLYLLGTIVGLMVLAFGLFLIYIFRTYFGVVARIFQERPLFVVPNGRPAADGENVRFRTTDGLTLAGTYLATKLPQRRGVILFGPEYGSNRWSCMAYCDHLRSNGYDIFTFDFRNQGESDSSEGYEPLQWVTTHEVLDMEAAVSYLKQRPDAPAQGIGVFGISRGGCAGIVTASRDPWIRCAVTDGAFATRSTMVPYMRKWVAIYSQRLHLQWWLPGWFYILLANGMLHIIGKQRKCRYPSLKMAIGKISPRPLFMIHGGSDTYIKPAIARELFDKAEEPKEFWLVEGAKHNQALVVVGMQYHQRILEFFNHQLVSDSMDQRPSAHEPPAIPEPIAVS